MRKEFIGMVSRIASRFYAPIENPTTMARKLSKSMGMPSTKIVVDCMEKISKKIKLTAPDGKAVEQVVEIAGLLGQCFFYRQMGHLARDCPKRSFISHCGYCRQNGHKTDDFSKKKGRGQEP